MANMLRLALQDDEFKKIASAKSFTPKERNVQWRNKHKLMHYEDNALLVKLVIQKEQGEH